MAALDSITTRFRAGGSTAVLAAPGGGATSLLRVVSGRIRAVPASAVTWAGASYDGLATAGVSLPRLAAYCGEADEHEVHYTVREDLDFAYAAAVVPAPTDKEDESEAVPTPADIIAATGLASAADTIAGGFLVRGLSGGERRRLSVAETLVLNRRVVCLDKPTDGLDAATSFTIMRYATTWARKSGGTLLAALQQPTPETLALFDEVLLLGEGRLLYHGPNGAPLDSFLTSIGLPRPSYAELAEWCIEVVSNPAGAAEAVREDAATGTAEEAAAAPAAVVAAAATAGDVDSISSAVGIANLVTVAKLPLAPLTITTAAIADAWAAQASAAKPQSPEGIKEGEISGDSSSSALLATAYARRQYGIPSWGDAAAAFVQHSRLVLVRELRLSVRNWIYIAARIALTAGMGFVLGSVFAYVDNPASCCTIDGTPPAYLKFSAILYALTFIAFLNQSSVPFTMVSRAVAYKLTAAGVFGELSYIAAVLTASAPLAMATDVLFVIPFYFLVTLANDAGRFFFFLLVVILQDFSTSTLYRALAYAAPSEEAAMIFCGLLIAVGLSLGNYFVIATQVGWWLRWLIYISPFYWSETACVEQALAAEIAGDGNRHEPPPPPLPPIILP